MTLGHEAVVRGVGLVEHDVRGFDRDLAAIGHRVARVEHQIEQRLLELARVGGDRADARLQGARYGNPVAGERGQLLLRRPHEVIQIHELRLERLHGPEFEDRASRA